MSISRCCYFQCPSCKAVYKKSEVLKSWSLFVMDSESPATVFGTRTCECGKVMSVQEIYNGGCDLPRKLWSAVPPPWEI